ncbi:MAG: MFS transporter [Lachnospiraceae bacterium]|nr:MFS transporter [Lachnospiraceae bacterium]MDD3616374.1 MFS transporter [Lachnospiraceae bacterium]
MRENQGNIVNEKVEYNHAKLWQIACFPLNNLATNIFMFLMMYVSYLAVGGYGIAVVAISTIITATRLFDAVTDPIIGFIIDKTSTKIGKFRPMILLGYTIMVISLILMYYVAIGGGTVTFILIYLVYIVGYTFQTACTKSAQTCITNDPKQRPLFTRCDAIYVLGLATGMAMYVSNYLQPKYGELGVAAMQEFCFTSIILAGICTILAIAALWQKDIPENWGLGGTKGPAIKFKDYISVLKDNRAIQMLVVSASTDKLALTAAGNSAIMVMIFGIVIGNYGFYGKLSMITIIPSILIILLGTRLAQKKGSKKALVQYTWLAILFAVLLFLVFIVFDPTKIGSGLLPTAAFLIIYCLFTGVKSISSNIVIPMIADCADYETYLSGRYVPGMMGTLFSFVDKIISALSTTIVGLLLAAIGYKTVMPQVGDSYTSTIFWVSMITFLGLPILGWIASLIAMKFYPLDEEKMREVQEHIAEIKAENAEA